MTVIATGLSTVNRGNTTKFQGGLYYTNGYDPVKVWYGIKGQAEDAGITGPTLEIGAPTAAAGGLSNGNHLIRYRYKNTTTGYVSNPSPALTYAVAGGNGLLTFGIGAADDIRTTTDTKVDQYVIEATAVGGGTFYQLGVAALGATTVVLGMVDSSLIQQFNSDSEYGSSQNLETYSAEVPPLCAIMVPCRGFMFYLGDDGYDISGATFTLNSNLVAGTGFSTRWEGKLVQKSGDTNIYEITAATTTQLTLSVNFTGATATTTGKVVSRFPNRGQYSRRFYPEQCYASVWARDFLAEKADQITAALSREDGLYVFGSANAERLIFNTNPSALTSTLQPLQGNRGALTQRCVVDVEGVVYSWDRQGMWIVGHTPKHISGAIDNDLEALVDYDERDQFHAGFDPANRLVIFVYVAAGDTEPKNGVVYEIDTGRWHFFAWLQAMTCSSLVQTSDGLVRLMLGDENGFSWYAGIDSSFDGTPPNFPTVVTVAAGSTSTVINVVETLPTTTPGLEGVMVYDATTGASRYCVSNTASTITIGSSFPSIRPADRELYLGPIEVEFRTKWWVGPSQATLKAPTYLIISLFPGTSTGTMRIYFYTNFSTSPEPLTAWVADVAPDGVTVTNGASSVVVELDGGSGDGLLSIPLPFEWENAVQARITSRRPDGDLRIFDAYFSLDKKGVISDEGT